MKLLGIFNLHGIVIINDLIVAGLDLWRGLSSFCWVSRSTRHGDDVGVVWLLEQVSKFAPPNCNLVLQESNGWVYKLGSK